MAPDQQSITGHQHKGLHTAPTNVNTNNNCTNNGNSTWGPQRAMALGLIGVGGNRGHLLGPPGTMGLWRIG